MNLKPESIEELQALFRSDGLDAHGTSRSALSQDSPRLLPRGGGSKPGLSTPAQSAQTLEMSGLSGISAYVPEEFTFTALAGTRLAEVNRALEENGQYLPFDPPLVERGATLGGTVAAGLSGPGRYHYGGLRDFLLGVRFVDGQGNLVQAGGQVVKNAAGFDLPKLMIGSRGSLGALVELSFKVFPRPPAYATLRCQCASLEEALQAMQRAAGSRLDVDALDLEPSQGGYILWVRLAGLAEIMDARLERLTGQVAEALQGESQVLQGPDERQLWRLVNEFAWVPAEWSLVKVPLTPGRIAALESALERKPILRRYMAGGQAAWLALEGPPQELRGLLEEHRLSGLVLFGPPGAACLGEWVAGAGKTFYRRVKTALDPVGRFVEAAS
ncbi:MAG: FAD-binding protein [Chloroflexota bacterium]